MKDGCTNQYTLHQVTGTCWMNAVMTSLFYSEGMRTLLLRKLPFWKSTDSRKMIADILQQYYTFTDKEYSTLFEKMRPEKLLKLLHKEDPDLFEHDPDKKPGYFSGRYLFKLMSYLDVTNFVMLDALETKTPNVYDVYYGQYNVMDVIKGHKKYGKAKESVVDKYFENTPDVLMYMTKKSTDFKFYPKYYYKEQVSFVPAIIYNGRRYIADSMILSNFNQYLCRSGHEIAGITCKGNRYMYNGWIARTVNTGITEKIFRKVPCALMKHDWLDTSKKAFCIDSTKCDLHYQNNNAKESKQLCFSYSKGPRNYVYIREDLLSEKPKQKEIEVVEKPKPKEIEVVEKPKNTQNVEQPKKIKVIMKPKPKEAEKQQKITPVKQCPDDKILNEKTNRCVSKTGAVGKKLLAK